MRLEEFISKSGIFSPIEERHYAIEEPKKNNHNLSVIVFCANLKDVLSSYGKREFIGVDIFDTDYLQIVFKIR